MAIVPLWFPQLPWVFEVICGQNWPEGDEDALRRCAQAWDDALKSVAALAGDGDNTTLSTLSTVASMSADQFAQYWSQYTGTNVADTALGQLAAQCQTMVNCMYGQANEVEYTKLMIDVTLVLTYIQIIIALASAVATLGTSTAAVPVLTLIARLTVENIVLRLVETVLTMMLPDLIAQGWMLAVDHTATSWDGSKTQAAAENAIAGVVIGSLLGAAGGKLLGLAGEDFAKTFGGKAVALGAHFIEGGATMDLTSVATAGLNLGLAEWHGSKQDIQQAQQQWDQAVSLGNLGHQFVSGGIMGAAFFAPEMGSHGAPMSFTGSDGKTYVTYLSDSTVSQLTSDGALPDGYRGKVFDQGGKLVGTATFNGPDVNIDKPFSKPVSADLTSGPGGQGGFQLVHEGQVERWGYPPGGTDQGPVPDGTASPGDRPAAQQLSYTVTSHDPVSVPTGDGTMTGAKGSVLHYTPDGALYRADLVDPGGTGITTLQTADPGPASPLSVTGRQVFDYGPADVGKAVGLHGISYYDANGDQVASMNAVTRQTSFLGDSPGDRPGTGYMNAFGDQYNPVGTPGATPTHAATAAPFEPATASALVASDNSSAASATATAGLSQLPGHDEPLAPGPQPSGTDSFVDPNALAAAQQALQSPGDLTAQGNGAAPPPGERPATDLPPTSDQTSPNGHETAPGGHPAGGGEGHARPGLPVHADLAAGLGPTGQHPVPDGLTPFDPPPGSGLEHLRGSLFRSEAGIAVYDGRDYRMLEAASHVQGDGMSFLVDIHAIDGVPQAGTHGGMTPEAFVDLLKAGGWDGEQRVVLLGCRTGGEESFAARVAAQLAARPDAHPVEVIAASTDVWQSTHDGNVMLFNKTWDEQSRMWVPDTSQPGQWLSHEGQPDGTVAIHEVPFGENNMPATDEAPKPVSASPASPGEPALAGNQSAHSPPVAQEPLTAIGSALNPPAEDMIFRGDPLGLPDQVVKDMPESVVAYKDDPAQITAHSTGTGTSYSVTGRQGSYPTREQAMEAPLRDFANRLRDRARPEYVQPDQVPENAVNHRQVAAAVQEAEAAAGTAQQAVRGSQAAADTALAAEAKADDAQRKAYSTANDPRASGADVRAAHQAARTALQEATAAREVARQATETAEQATEAARQATAKARASAVEAFREETRQADAARRKMQAAVSAAARDSAAAASLEAAGAGEKARAAGVKAQTAEDGARAAAETARPANQDPRASSQDVRNAEEDARSARQVAQAARQEAQAGRQQAQAARQEVRATRDGLPTAEDRAQAAEQAARAAEQEAHAAREEALAAGKEAQAAQRGQRVVEHDVSAAKRDAERTQADAQAAGQEAVTARREAETARQEAEAARQEAQAAEQEARAAEQRAHTLETEAAAARDRAWAASHDSRTAREAREAGEDARATADRARAARETELASRHPGASGPDPQAAEQEARTREEEARDARHAAQAARQDARDARDMARSTRHDPGEARQDAAAADAEARAAEEEAQAARSQLEAISNDPRASGPDIRAAESDAEQARREAQTARREAQTAAEAARAAEAAPQAAEMQPRRAAEARSPDEAEAARAVEKAAGKEAQAAEERAQAAEKQAQAAESAAQALRREAGAPQADSRAPEEPADERKIQQKAAEFRARARAHLEQAGNEGRTAAAHDAVAAKIRGDSPILNRDERNQLPAAAAALVIDGDLIIATGARGPGEVPLHPVVKELYEQARSAIIKRFSEIDQRFPAAGVDERQLLLQERAELVDQLKQNGRCAEAIGLSEWAKGRDAQLRQSNPNRPDSWYEQQVQNALRRRGGASLAVDIRYADEAAGHGQLKLACVNCEHVERAVGITDEARGLAPQRAPEVTAPEAIRLPTHASDLVFRGDSAPPPVPEEPREGAPSQLAGVAGGNERAVWAVSGQAVPDTPAWYHGPRTEFYGLGDARNEQALYALYDRATHAFLKFGISEDPHGVRYRDGLQRDGGTRRPVDVFVVAKFEKFTDSPKAGKMSEPEVLAQTVERYLVKRWAGPDSHEAWAGTLDPTRSGAQPDPAWQAVRDLVDKPGTPGGWPATPQEDQQFRDQLTAMIKSRIPDAINERLTEINADPGLGGQRPEAISLQESLRVLNDASGVGVDRFLSVRQADVHLFEASRYDKMGDLNRIYGDLAFAEPTMEQVRGSYHQVTAEADLLGTLVSQHLAAGRATFDPQVQRVRDIAAELLDAADKHAAGAPDALPAAADIRDKLREVQQIHRDIVAQARKVDARAVRQLLADPNALPGLTRSEPYEVGLSWLREQPGMAPIADLVNEMGAERWGDWPDAAKCVHSSLAYEASRRLGESVQPTELPATHVNGAASGRQLAELASVWGDQASFTEISVQGGSSTLRVANQVRAVFKGLGDGARGLVAVGYPDGSGHVLNVENVRGRVIFPDALDGKLDARYRFENASYVSYLRTDDRNPVPAQIQKFIDLPGGVSADRLLDPSQPVPSSDAHAQPDPQMQRRMGQGGLEATVSLQGTLGQEGVTGQAGNAGEQPSRILSALNPPPEDLVFRGGTGPSGRLADPLSPQGISEALARMAEQRQHDQQAFTQLEREHQDITAELAGQPTAQEHSALAGRLREIGHESGMLDLAERERTEHAQLLAEYSDAEARHADTIQRLAEAKSRGEDYLSTAAYELMTRHEVADLKAMIGAWERTHPDGLLHERTRLLEYQGAAARIQDAATALAGLPDSLASLTPGQIQDALDKVNLAREAGREPGLLPPDLTLRYRTQHDWQTELTGIAAHLQDVVQGKTTVDLATRDAAAAYLADGARRADDSVARTQHDLRVKAEMLAAGSTVDPRTGSILAVPALGEPAEAEPPRFSIVPAILSGLLDPKGMLAMDGVPLADRLAVTMRSADDALLRDLLDRTRVLEYPVAARQIRDAATAAADLRDAPGGLAPGQLKDALDKVNLALEAGRRRGLLPPDLARGDLTHHDWETELAGIAAHLRDAMRGRARVDPATLDAAAAYLDDSARHARDTATRTAQDMRAKAESVKAGDLGFQLAAMVKRVPYTDTHLESMPQAGLHDGQTQQVSFWPRLLDIQTADGTRALLVVADNIKEERSFTHEVYPHSLRVGYDHGVLGVSAMGRVQYSDKTTFDMDHEGARAVVGWVHEPGGGWRQVSGYLPGETILESQKRKAGWDLAWGVDATIPGMDISVGGKLKYSRQTDQSTGAETFTSQHLFGFAWNQDFGMIQHGDQPGHEIPLPHGDRIWFSYNAQKDGKLAVEVWPIRERDPYGVPTVTPRPVSLDTPVIGPIRRWLLEHGAPREIVPPEPPRPQLPEATAQEPPPTAPRPPAGPPPYLTPQQELAFQHELDVARQSGDPALISQAYERCMATIDQEADARLAAVEQQAAQATAAAEEAMRRVREEGQQRLRQQQAQQQPGQESS
jgi:hypothetical protein